MPDFVLAAAGALVFALTTWASLAFGYQVFQNLWEEDQSDDAVPTGLPDDRSTPLLKADHAVVEVAHPNDPVFSATPTT